jgi:rhodanese-related sulfurtransferase
VKYKKLIKIALLLFVIFSLGYLIFNDKENLKSINIIRAEDVHKIISSDKNEYVLIDTRPSFKYLKEHIKGALNYEYYKKAYKGNVLRKDILEKVSKNKKIIFYCTGNKRAYFAAKVSIEKWGFPKKRIYWFKGGIIEWKQKKYKTKKGS